MKLNVYKVPGYYMHVWRTSCWICEVMASNHERYSKLWFFLQHLACKQDILDHNYNFSFCFQSHIHEVLKPDWYDVHSMHELKKRNKSKRWQESIQTDRAKQRDDEGWFSGAIQASQRQRQTLFLFSADCFSKLAFTFQNTYRQVHARTHSGIDENQHPAGTELWLYLHTHTAWGEHFILWMLYKHKYPPPTLSLSP